MIAAVTGTVSVFDLRFRVVVAVRSSDGLNSGMSGAMEAGGGGADGSAIRLDVPQAGHFASLPMCCVSAFSDLRQFGHSTENDMGVTFLLVPNDQVQQAATADDEFKNPQRFAAMLQRFGTPVMGVNLWGGSPLCDSGSLRRPVYQMGSSDRVSTRRGLDIPRATRIACRVPEESCRIECCDDRFTLTATQRRCERFQQSNGTNHAFSACLAFERKVVQVRTAKVKSG